MWRRYLKVTAFMADWLISGASIPWNSARGPSARTVARRQSAAPAYCAWPACSRTLMVSNGWPMMMETLPLIQPAMLSCKQFG